MRASQILVSKCVLEWCDCTLDDMLCCLDIFNVFYTLWLWVILATEEMWTFQCCCLTWHRCGGWCGWAEPGAGLRYQQNGNLIWNGWRRFCEVTLCLTVFQCLKGVFLNQVMFGFVRIWWQSSVRHRFTVLLFVLNQFCVLDPMCLLYIIENNIFTVLSLQLS